MTFNDERPEDAPQGDPRGGGGSASNKPMPQGAVHYTETPDAVPREDQPVAGKWWCHSAGEGVTLHYEDESGGHTEGVFLPEQDFDVGAVDRILAALNHERLAAHTEGPATPKEER